MKVKLPPKLQVGKRVKNIYSGQISIIKKLSPVNGWFQTDNNEWKHRTAYLVEKRNPDDRLPKKTAKLIHKRKKRKKTMD